MDTSLRLAGDFELWSRFMRHAAPWCVEVPLGLFRYRPGQQTEGQRQAYLAEAEAVFRRDGGRPPGRIGSALRVGLHEPRLFLVHRAAENRWEREWR